MKKMTDISKIPARITKDPEWLAWANIINSFYSADGSKFDCDHGVKHWRTVSNIAADFVLKTTKDSRTATLARIAGLLHDCGLIFGDEKHDKNGSIMAKAFLMARFDKLLSNDEIETICHAIAHHSNGNNIKTIIDAAIHFADKIDVTRNRILIVSNPLLAEANKIQKIDYRITAKTLSVRYHVDDGFQPDIFFAWRKAYEAPARVAKYTNRDFTFYINETAYNLP